MPFFQSKTIILLILTLILNLNPVRTQIKSVEKVQTVSPGQGHMNLHGSDITLHYSQVFKLPQEIVIALSRTEHIPSLQNQLLTCKQQQENLKNQLYNLESRVKCIIKNIKKPSLVEECPCNGCNGKGKCVEAAANPSLLSNDVTRQFRCECRAGFEGDHCQISDCPSGCNLKQGKCLNGRCVCNEGFAGSKCNFKSCPNNCGGRSRGRCVKKTGECRCRKGYHGEDCSLSGGRFG